MLQCIFKWPLINRFYFRKGFLLSLPRNICMWNEEIWMKTGLFILEGTAATHCTAEFPAHHYWMPRSFRKGNKKQNGKLSSLAFHINHQKWASPLKQYCIKSSLNSESLLFISFPSVYTQKSQNIAGNNINSMFIQKNRGNLHEPN